MRRTIAAAGLLILIGLAARAADPLGADLGGAGSRPATNKMAFSLPAANLPRADQRAFFFGNRLFNTNWVQAPSSTRSFDGLGPTFNRVSCSGCHLRDGRGRPPEEPGGELLSMLIRLSLPGETPQGGPMPHPTYGDQLNDRAIQGVPAEGRAEITWREHPGRYADGTPYSLRELRVEVMDAAFGELGPDVMLSPRVATSVIGLGLLEAVPEATIRALADPGDRDGDGISGRVNEVWDARPEVTSLGRFGWKANSPNLHQQNASAAIGDIGLTNALAPDQNCPVIQKDCEAAKSGGSPELSDVFLAKLTLYTQALAVPLRREIDRPEVRRGQRLFENAGCAACHRGTLQTGDAPAARWNAHQTIHPFTDLLLHDMGPGLADGRPDFLASGSEWRTAPLWGLGLQQEVVGHELLLHDGRARGPAEAILWHGGEAERSREAFRTMPEQDREALLAFLRSL
jgi:CxxC motif-containing protein (DUF1111 family)